VNGQKEREVLVNAFGRHPEVLFAYLHGSSLCSETPRDVDVAVTLDPGRFSQLQAGGQVLMAFAIPLELELEAALGRKTDVQVLNRAPLGFRYRVVSQGVVVVDRDPLARERFEYLSRVEYFDFRRRRQEYLREAGLR